MRTHIFKISLLLVFVSFLSCQSKKATKKKNTPILKEAKTPAVKPTIAIAYGIDISQYQGDEVDLLNKKKDSLSFIICKATEGITYIDPKFHQNWQVISAKKFIKGAYHFYRCQDNPKQQAAHYLNTVQKISNTDLPPIVDFEQAGIDASQSVKQIQDNLLIFLNEVAHTLQRKPMIYTNFYVANQYLNIPEFAQYPLWIADYTSQKQPMTPTTWKNKSWSFWQQKDSYRLDHITSDFDRFNGNPTQLKAFIKNNSK